jgi:hypothetical protein
LNPVGALPVFERRQFRRHHRALGLIQMAAGQVLADYERECGIVVALKLNNVAVPQSKFRPPDIA